MKLELIVPATKENLKRRTKAVVPPLGMAMVAALTPPEVDVSLTDENITTVDFDKEADLVGMTALTCTTHRAYQIADAFRARGVKVVMGGIHPSSRYNSVCSVCSLIGSPSSRQRWMNSSAE